MDSSSQNTHEDITSDIDDEEIPIPNNLRFTVDSLKTLTLNPLTPDNHLIWFSQIEATFRANGYLKYLDPKTPSPPPFILTQDGHQTKNPRYPKYNLINQTLMTALTNTISPPLQPLALRLNTVADIYTTLKSYLQSQSRSHMIQLKAELHSLSMRGSDLPQYLTRVKTIYDQLEATGCHIDDEDMILYTMNGLPTQFNAYIAAYRLKSKKINLPTFFSLLKIEATNIHRRHQQQYPTPDPHLALATTHTYPKPTPSHNPNYKSKNLLLPQIHPTPPQPLLQHP